MEEELTPLQLSAARSGRRFFRAPEQVYVALCQQIDARRGFPAGVGSKAPTMRGLPQPDDCQHAENGDVLISTETWRIEPTDEEMLTAAIGAGMIAELTDAEFVARPEEPEEH